MKRITLAVSAAALLAGTTFASAQVYWDDPPGYAFQRRSVIDESGRSPYGYRGAYGAYGYDGYAVVPGPRYYRRDNPPGSRFQDRGIEEDKGNDPLGWRRW